MGFASITTLHFVQQHSNSMEVQHSLSPALPLSHCFHLCLCHIDDDHNVQTLGQDQEALLVLVSALANPFYCAAYKQK